MKKYLALGDSYTIGEQVEQNHSFPFQTKSILKNYYGIELTDPEIIAKTGWTTKELLDRIDIQKPEKDFSLVTLLIGVNNQYRNQDINIYSHEFNKLLDLAITFASGNPKRVFVLSIPDWGQTPFAKGKDKLIIKYEINAYNKINESITMNAGANYLNITPNTRMHGMDLQFLTPDLLHYNKHEYQQWSEKLCELIAATNVLN